MYQDTLIKKYLRPTIAKTLITKLQDIENHSCTWDLDGWWVVATTFCDVVDWLEYASEKCCSVGALCWCIEGVLLYVLSCVSLEVLV